MNRDLFEWQAALHETNVTKPMDSVAPAPTPGRSCSRAGTKSSRIAQQVPRRRGACFTGPSQQLTPGKLWVLHINSVPGGLFRRFAYCRTGVVWLSATAIQAGFPRAERGHPAPNLIGGFPRVCSCKSSCLTEQARSAALPLAFRSRAKQYTDQRQNRAIGFTPMRTCRLNRKDRRRYLNRVVNQTGRAGGDTGPDLPVQWWRDRADKPEHPVHPRQATERLSPLWVPARMRMRPGTFTRMPRPAATSDRTQNGKTDQSAARRRALLLYSPRQRACIFCNIINYLNCTLFSRGWLAARPNGVLFGMI